MHNLLLFDESGGAFSVDSLDRIFKSTAGFEQPRYDTPTGTLIEAGYSRDGDFTTVRLGSECETISISGTSDAALHAAWILHTQLQTRLRIVDTEYSFNLVLSDFLSFEQLQAAIDEERASNA